MSEKHIPQLSKFLIGHHKQINTFKLAFKNNKLHHSWMLTGDYGIGKATFAYSVAVSLLNNNNLDIKLNNNQLESKDDYKTNQEIILHPDLKIINSISDDSLNNSNNIIPVSKVREIDEFYSKKSTFNTWRISIIDSLDNLNVFGLNALLKILEEPPQKSLILLVSNKNSNVLSTLKSRCNILKFYPLKQNECKNILKYTFPDITQETMDKLLILSNGSPGKAVNIYNNEGLELYSYIIKLFLLLPNISFKSLGNIYERLSIRKNNDGLQNFKILLTIFISRSIKFNLGGISNFINEEESKAMKNCLENINPPDLSEFWQIACEIINEANIYNLDKKQVILEIVNILKEHLKSDKERYTLN